MKLYWDNRGLSFLPFTVSLLHNIRAPIIDFFCVSNILSISVLEVPSMPAEPDRTDIYLIIIVCCHLNFVDNVCSVLYRNRSSPSSSGV